MKGPARSEGRRFAAVAGLFALAFLALSADAMAQCSMCRDAVAASSPQTREAMNYAIVGLAMAPYGVAALAAWTLSPTVRARVRQELKRLSLRLRESRP